MDKISLDAGGPRVVDNTGSKKSVDDGSSQNRLGDGECLIGTKIFRKEDIDESEAYRADIRANRANGDLGDRDVNKAMWRMHYRNEAKLQMMMNVGTLGGIADITFILPPLMQGNRPYLMRLGKHILVCKSAKAAAKSVGVAAQGPPSDRFTLHELTSKREITVLTKSDKHPGPSKRNVRQYMNRGSNVYSYYDKEYVAGFEFVGDVTTWEMMYDFVVKPASFEMTMLMNSVSGGTVDSRGAYLQSILPPGAFNASYTELCDTFIAIATLNIEVSDDWCLLCKRLISDDVVHEVVQDVEVEVEEGKMEVQQVVVKKELDELFEKWIEMLDIAKPLYIQSIAGVCAGYGGFMPCEDGWGYLTRIVTNSQIMKRGPSALGLGQVVLNNLINANSGSEKAPMNKMLSSLYSVVCTFLRTEAGSDQESNTLAACSEAINNLIHTAYGDLYDDVSVMFQDVTEEIVHEQRMIYKQAANEVDNSICESHIKSLEKLKVERSAERMDRSLARLQDAQLTRPTENSSLRQSIIRQRRVLRDPEERPPGVLTRPYSKRYGH